MFIKTISGHILGCKHIWIIRDEFMAQTANQYFKQACYMPVRGQDTMSTHCGDNFEIKLFHATEYGSNVCDFMAHLCNTLAGALNDEKLLPKAIVFVLDDEMIKYANINKFGMSLAYGKLLHYLMSEINKLILAKKDFLPVRSRCPHQSEMIWINPPFHSGFKNNSQRNKFSRAFDTTAAIYDDTWSLKLKHIWDTQGSELFLPEVNRYSAKGLMTYWMAVDPTIRFWDTALSSEHQAVRVNAAPTTPHFQGAPVEKNRKKNFWQRQKTTWKKRQ